MLGKLEIVKDLILFLKERKLWWLIPLVIVFLIFGVLLIFVGSSPLAPLIYPIF